MLNKLKRARLQLIGSLSSLALLAAGPAWADAIQWTTEVGPLWNGVYWTSPYSVHDQSSNQDILLYCLDFNNDIHPPDYWLANLNLLSPSNLGQFQYGGSYPNPSVQPVSDPYHRYLEAAWLFTNMIYSPSTDPNTALISQVAAWLLFVDASHSGSLNTQIGNTTGAFTFTDYVGGQGVTGGQVAFSDAVNEALNASQNAVLQGGWTAANNWAVVTADPNWVNSPTGNNGTPVQEFLTPVPEPNSILSMGTLLLAAGLVLRKRHAGMPKFRR